MKNPVAGRTQGTMGMAEVTVWWQRRQSHETFQHDVSGVATAEWACPGGGPGASWPPAPSSGLAPTGALSWLGDCPLLTHGRLPPATFTVCRNHLCVTTGQVGMAATQLERPAIDPFERLAQAPG